MKCSASQVEVVLGDTDNPKLPPQMLDAVLIVNSYHEMPQHQKMLEHIREALKPGGRLVLVEPFAAGRRADPREAQEKDHLIAPEIVEEDLKVAGFVVVTRNEEFARHAESNTVDWMILARRK